MEAILRCARRRWCQSVASWGTWFFALGGLGTWGDPAWALSPSSPTPEALCAFLAQRLPDLGARSCAKAALVASGASSVRGMPLYQTDVLPQSEPMVPAVSLSASPTPAEPLRVLVLGGMHGDELSSVALAFRWIALARKQSGGVAWRFVPLLNPDGLMQVRPTRTNANGVDLNRNFPTPGWMEQAPQYWAQRAGHDPRRYPGPTPMSEPETRFVLDQITNYRPQLIVTLHAPYGVLDFDGPTPPPQRLGRLYLDQLGVYPGSLGNYGGVHRGVPVVTVELDHALRIPQPRQVLAMWQDLLRWIRGHLQE